MRTSGASRGQVCQIHNQSTVQAQNKSNVHFRLPFVNRTDHSTTWTAFSVRLGVFHNADAATDWDHHWLGTRPIQPTVEMNTEENMTTSRGGTKLLSGECRSKKVFRCHLCPYIGCSNSNLIQHVMVHTGERPFKCTLCAFASTRRHDVKVHMRLHTGEKPFLCHICRVRFRRKYDLKRHAVTVHGVWAAQKAGHAPASGWRKITWYAEVWTVERVGECQ